MVVMFQNALPIVKCLSKYTSWWTGNIMNMYAIDTKKGAVSWRERIKQQSTVTCQKSKGALFKKTENYDMKGCSQNMALTIKEGAHKSPGSRDYQASWKKTGHLLLNDKTVFKVFQMLLTYSEWFFLAKIITKKVKQWKKLSFRMFLLQKDQCISQSKW